MTEQLLHIDVILVSFWSEFQLERAQSQVLGLASLLCANVRFVCDNYNYRLWGHKIKIACT